MINFLVNIGDLNRNNPLKYDFKEVEKIKAEREKILKFLKKENKKGPGNDKKN